MAEDPTTPEVEEEELQPEPEPEVEEPEPEPEPEEPDGEAEPEPKASDREKNLGHLRRANQELKERLERLERTQPRVDPTEQQRREREEDEQVALSGDPVRIAQHYNQKLARAMNGQMAQVTGYVADARDEAKFEAACSQNEVLGSIRDEVERRLAEARAQGLNPQRTALAYYILGERQAARAKGAKTRQTRRAEAEVRRQTARPASPRSDVSPGGGRSQKNDQAERAKRLDESGQL